MIKTVVGGDAPESKTGDEYLSIPERSAEEMLAELQRGWLKRGIAVSGEPIRGAAAVAKAMREPLFRRPPARRGRGRPGHDPVNVEFLRTLVAALREAGVPAGWAVRSAMAKAVGRQLRALRAGCEARVKMLQRARAGSAAAARLPEALRQQRAWRAVAPILATTAEGESPALRNLLRRMQRS